MPCFLIAHKNESTATTKGAPGSFNVRRVWMTYPIKWNRAFRSDRARAINLPQDWQTKKLNAVIENVVCKSRRNAGNTRPNGRLSVAIENFTLVVFLPKQSFLPRPRSCPISFCSVTSGVLPEQERWPQEMQNRFVTRKSANQSTMVTLFYQPTFHSLAIHPRKWYLHGNIKERGKREGQGRRRGEDNARMRLPGV